MKIIILFLISFSINLSAQENNDCLKNYNHSIKYVQPNNDNSDLNFLKDYVKDKSIISLGEATHGSSEVFTIKHRLIKYLIEEEKFNIFAIEANMAEAEELNQFIQTGKGNPAQLLANLGYWVWTTQEVLDLVNWMRTYNKNHTKKIKFTGFDMQSYQNAFLNIKKYYPKEILKIKSIIYNIDSIDNKITSNKLKGIYQINDTIIETMYLESNSLLNAIKTLDNNQIENIESDNYEWLLQNCRLLVQFATRYSVHKPKKGYRDLCLATNLKWIKDNNANAKIIVWAHNGHVKRDTNTMGSYLIDLELNPYVIGFSTFKGTYTAISKGKFAINKLSEPNNDCYEYYFNQSDFSTFFIDLKELAKSNECTFISNKYKFREIGSMKRDVQFYKSNLLNEYDAIIHIENTTSSKLLYE